HLFSSEVGGLGAIAGVQTHIINSKNGMMDIVDIHHAIREKDIHHPVTKLISLENTHANSGGKVLSLDYMSKVHDIARKNNILIHLDGARIFNAAVNLKIKPHLIADFSDTVQICLSKGLGAPVGSLLLGPKKTINQA